MKIKFLAYYLLFIIYFFIEVTDANFFYRINIPELNKPMYIAVMMNDAILIIFLLMFRIYIGSKFNDKI